METKTETNMKKIFSYGNEHNVFIVSLTLLVFVLLIIIMQTIKGAIARFSAHAREDNDIHNVLCQ